MRLLVFIPDDDALKGALEETLKRYPKAKRIEMASLPGATFEEKLGPLGEAIASADPKSGFVITDPPREAADLKRFDRLCREKLGKNALPRAVFFVPPKKKMEPEWAKTVKAAHRHFHPSRRTYDFVKAQPKPLRKAVTLAAKSSSIIRWGTAGPMGAFVIACAIMLVFFRNPILKAAAVEGLQAAFSARAEIDAASSDFQPSLGFDAVSVANRTAPMTNLFEVGRINADVDLAPLLGGRIHAEELALEGLKFDTPRETDGSLPGVEPEPPAPVEEPEVGPTFEEEIAKMLEGLKPPDAEDFETVRVGREIEKESRERLARLEAMVSDNPFQARLDKLGSMKPPALPPSAKEALAELEGLKPDAAGIEEARRELEAVAKIDFTKEQAAIGKAQKDLESAKATLDAAKSTVARAQELKKVSFLEVPKLLALIKDVAALKDGLATVGEKVQGAQAGLQKAAGDVKAKQEDAAKRLQAVDARVAEARKQLEASRSDLPGRVEKLSPKLVQARKDIEAEKAKLEGAAGGADGLGALKADFEKFRKQLADDLAFMESAPARLEAAMEKDRRMLEERYDLENFGADALVRALLGEEAAGYVALALAARTYVWPYLSRLGRGDKPSKTPGPSGTTYHFPGPEDASPRFWIKKAVFSGEYPLQGEAGMLKGEIHNLCSNMAYSGADTKGSFTIEAGPRKVTVDLVITPAGEFTLDVKAEGFSLDGAKVENKHIRADLSGGTFIVSSKGVIGEARLEAAGTLAFDGLKITPGGDLDPKLAFLGDAMKSVESMQVDMKIAWVDGGPSFSVSSGEGADLTKTLRSAMAAPMEEAKKQALAGFESQVAGPRKAAEDAAKRFLGQAPGKGETIASGVDFGSAVDAGELDRAMALLSQEPDPQAILAAMEKELAGLTTASANQRRSKETDGNAQAAAAGTALESVKAQADRIGELRKQLDAELERLQGLK